MAARAGAEKVGGIYYEVAYDTRPLIDGRSVIDRETQRAAQSFNAITAAVKLLAAAMAVLKFAQVADDLRLLQARVDVAAGSIEAGAQAMDDLRGISTRTRTALADNVTVFTRLNSSIRQLGGDTADTLRITELLSKAITVSGASAAEKSSAMIQFGQALGSGKLAGDELRSLLENAPYLMQQLAAGIGVPVGALKSLGEQGKLTSDVVVNALSKAAGRIEADFAKFPQTVGGGLTLAEDGAKRAGEAFDRLSGLSTALTGLLTGAGEALQALATALGVSNTEADKLARNAAIKEWALETRNGLSYVADAADVTWQVLSVLGRNVKFVYEGIRDEVVGIAKQLRIVQDAAKNGRSITDPFGTRAAWEAMNSPEYEAISTKLKADGEERRRILDDADAATLADRKLWGERMRDEWAQRAREDRGFTPASAPSKLKATADPEEQRKLAARRAAAQAYYEGLLADAQSGLAKIDAEEQKALAEHERRVLENKDNDEKVAETLEKAKVAIAEKYTRERKLLGEQTAQEVAAFNIAITTDEQAKIEAIRTEAFRTAQAQQDLGLKTAEQASRMRVLAAVQAEQAIKALQSQNLGFITGTLQIRADNGDQKAQEGLIDADATARLQAAKAALEQGIVDQQTYADREVAIIEDRNRRLAKLRDERVQVELEGQALVLGATSGFFGQLSSLLQAKEGEDSRGARVAFAASKAFAIAQGTISLYLAALNAMKSGATPVQQFANYAAVFAAGGALLGTIANTSYGGGRQYGGPVDSGSLYRVNETGRPEMFTGSNGAQYMLPTQGGNVTPANQVGGGGVQLLVEIINQHPTAQVTQRGGIDGVTARFVITEIANQFATNTGEVWQGARQGSDIKPRL